MKNLQLQRKFLGALAKDEEKGKLIDEYDDEHWIIANQYAGWIVRKDELYLNPDKFRKMDGLNSIFIKKINENIKDYKEVEKVAEIIGGSQFNENEVKKLIMLQSENKTVYADKKYFKYFEENLGEKLYIKGEKEAVICLDKNKNLIGFILPIYVKRDLIK